MIGASKQTAPTFKQNQSRLPILRSLRGWGGEANVVLVNDKIFISLGPSILKDI